VGGVGWGGVLLISVRSRFEPTTDLCFYALRPSLCAPEHP